MQRQRVWNFGYIRVYGRDVKLSSFHAIFNTLWFFASNLSFTPSCVKTRATAHGDDGWQRDSHCQINKLSAEMCTHCDTRYIKPNNNTPIWDFRNLSSMHAVRVFWWSTVLNLVLSTNLIPRPLWNHVIVYQFELKWCYSDYLFYLNLII